MKPASIVMMIVVVTATVMIGSASLAAAECAWVLWGESAIRSVELPLVQPELSYMIMRAHSTQQECEKQREVLTPKWEKHKEMHKENVEKMGGTVQVSYSARLICLPDTIDPREKKE